MRYVIIGNSAAGVGTVEGIRQNDKDSEIIIISNEPYHTYSRPLISYLLLGKTTEEKMKYRSDSFYEDNKCQTILSKNVVDIDVDQKRVILDDETDVYYDKLMVATGSRPFVPPMNGLDNVVSKFTFSSLEDAKELDCNLNPKSNVLIIGAGLIGLKCAEGIKNHVGSIKIVDLAPNVLSSILDDDASSLVKEYLEKNGLEFFLNDSVSEFKSDQAILSSGKTIDFDVLVLAVGVRPNIELFKNIGAKVGRGVFVNNQMETTVPDIYAAGDCTESMDVSSGDIKIMALLPNAYMQGECAGLNMSGAVTYFDKAIPMNAIGFFGLHIITAGNYKGSIYFEREGNNYKKIFYEDNYLKGYILIGNIDKAGIYTSLIREKTPLDTIDFNLICEKPGLMAFSKDARAKKLGGS